MAIKSGDKVAIKVLPQDIIVAYLRENGKIGSDQAMTITGLKISRVKQIFKKLREDDVIVAEGANRNRMYRLKD